MTIKARVQHRQTNQRRQTPHNRRQQTAQTYFSKKQQQLLTRLQHSLPMSTTSQRSRYEDGQKLIGDSQRTFIIINRIAGGGYGAVYKVKSTDGGQTYALKDEKREPNRDHYKLFMEAQVLQKAASKGDWQQRFPTLIDQHKGPENMFIVMTLLGESLADIKRRQPGRVFSANTALYCAIQSLEAIKALHEMGYIHRDIKPANFVIGQTRTQNWHRIYMVDFGIARRFLDNNGSILTPRQKTKFKGTVRFAPIATHKQEELGRKDDCESWIYMIVDMIKPERLPWHDSEDRKQVEQMKKNAMANPTLLFTDQQKELRMVCEYLRKQHYVDQLDYEWMRRMCRIVARRLQCGLDQPFDWSRRQSSASGRK